MGVFDFITKTKTKPTRGKVQLKQDDRLVKTPFSELKYPMKPSEKESLRPVQAEPINARKLPEHRTLLDEQVESIRSTSVQLPSTDTQQLPPLQDLQPAENEARPVIIEQPEDSKNALGKKLTEEKTFLNPLLQAEQVQSPPQSDPVDMSNITQGDSLPTDLETDELDMMSQNSDSIAQPTATQANTENAADIDSPLTHSNAEVSEIDNPVKPTEEDLAPSLSDYVLQAEAEVPTETPESAKVASPLVTDPAGVVEQTKDLTTTEPEKQPEVEFGTDVPDQSIQEPEIPPEVETKEGVVTSNEIVFKEFKSIGFVGLNHSEANTKIAEKLTELIKKLKTSNAKLVIDSANGYGKIILDSLDDKSGLTRIALKPKYSDYDDGTTEPSIKTEEYTNYNDKIEALMKASDVLVVPEVGEINNIAFFMHLWSIAYLYFGQHKPVILLGKEWSTILTHLKELFKLSEEEVRAVTVCTTADEVVQKLLSLDAEYNTKPKFQISEDEPEALYFYH